MRQGIPRREGVKKNNFLGGEGAGKGGQNFLFCFTGTQAY